MDKCNAVSSRYSGGNGWYRAPMRIDFKRSLQPRSPLWIRGLLWFAAFVVIVGMTVDLSVPS